MADIVVPEDLTAVVDADLTALSDSIRAEAEMIGADAAASDEALAQVEKLIRRIDLSFIVKESDRNYKNLQNAVCLPNLPFGYYINDDLEDKTITSLQNNQPVSIGFIGKLSYRPNYQSLINFINKIWKPIIKSGFSGLLLI